jgi:glucose-1-phosphate thymidylyltransferase
MLKTACPQDVALERGRLSADAVMARAMKLGKMDHAALLERLAAKIVGG